MLNILILYINSYKDFKILIIKIYLNKIFNIFKIIILVFYKFNNNKYLLIIDIIIIFN